MVLVAFINKLSNFPCQNYIAFKIFMTVLTALTVDYKQIVTVIPAKSIVPTVFMTALTALSDVYKQIVTVIQVESIVLPVLMTTLTTLTVVYK